MFGLIKKSFTNKIMATVIISIALVMVAEIVLRIYFGTKDRMEIVTTLNLDVSESIYSGITYPMHVGDSEAIVAVLTGVGTKMKNIEAWICSFDQEITWSTHEEKVKTQVADSISDEETLAALTKTLASGVAPEESFEVELAGKKVLITIQPILNDEDCYHCHGSSRRVLGGMIIGADVQHAYMTVVAARNRTILISFLGISIIIGIIYFMVARFIRRPVEDLADKAKKFAEGNMSVSVDVVSVDEIGLLGNAFNYMVQRAASFSKKLEQEVAKKTDLLGERTNLIALLEKANTQLRELDRLKSTFLANMSHELRTPMNSIIGYSDLLIDGVDGPINEEQEKSLNRISNNARHLLQLLNDLLDLSKIEAGKTEIEAKQFNLKELIDSVVPMFEGMISQKGLSLDFDIDENLPLVYGDGNKIQHVLMNLLSNAIKFTDKGGLTIRAGMSGRGIQPGESPLFAEVCVEDTGIGIKDEDLGKIFDKFVQADLSTVRQYDGTGLGLSIARGFITLHNGMIWATSKFGKGSQFYFTIPLKQETLDSRAKPIIELRMADALADYFNVPVETFLKDPQYAGEPVKCYDYVHCGQPSCPAYDSEERRCWLILGTHCAGLKVGAYPEKVDFCKNCEVVQKLVLESETSKTAGAKLSTKENIKQKTVLAIDDNYDTIDIIRKSLGEDYRVVGLLSGEKAVKKAIEIRPVAITLDIMMPYKDGWQVLRELKSTPETQNIPVIVLSIVDNKKLGFSLGAAEYMVKPLDKNFLLKKIRDLEKTGKIQRALVVDSDTDTVSLIEHTMQDVGCEVKTAYNSQDAIELVKSFIPHLIILNLTMPKVNGFDVIEYIKTDEKVRDIPLILITKRDLSEKEKDALDGRLRGILNKGVLKEEDLLQELKYRIDEIKST
ncbi:MAG: response regulator [Thermodesulfobacteriota bacterium]|nr:response regulator [Thermodesulfobacteriota bacterium]